MNQRNGASTRLWIRASDGLGKEIDPHLVEAAHRVWERARFIVIRYLAEDTETAEILETVVCSVAALKSGYSSIQNIETYLLKSVARESLRRRRRDGRLIFVDPGTLEQLAGSATHDWDQQLDEGRQMDLLRACLDQAGQKILDYRILDYDWRFIALALGYANGHSAEALFRKKLNRAVKRIRIPHGLSRTESQNSNHESP